MTVSTDEQCITHTQLLDQSFLILIDGDELAQIVGPVALQMHDHLIDAVVDDCDTFWIFACTVLLFPHSSASVSAYAPHPERKQTLRTHPDTTTRQIGT